MAGKWRRWANWASKPQKTLTIRKVFCVTGSGNISTRRRNGTDSGNRTFTRSGPGVSWPDLHARSIRRSGYQDRLGSLHPLAFLPRRPDISRESFCPTRSRVRHDGNGVAHITEVFGNSNPCVDGSSPRRYRHVRSVGDQNGPLHDGLTSRWINQFWKFIQNVRHFISTFPTTNVNDDVYIGKLGHLVLHDCFSSSERTRNSCSSTFCPGKKVSMTRWPVTKGSTGISFVQRDGLDEPAILHQGPSKEATICLLDLINRLFYRVRTCCDLSHTSTHTKGYHDAVFHHIGLLNGTDDVSSDHFCPFSHTWFEGPFGIPI